MGRARKTGKAGKAECSCLDGTEQARQYLFGCNHVKQDFDEAFRLFSLEADHGNAGNV